MELTALLQQVRALKASDLHLSVSRRPVVRIDGELQILKEAAPLTHADIERVMATLITADERAQLERERELDLAYSDVSGRYRVNIAYADGAPYVSLRALAQRIPTLEELELPAVCGRLALLSRGLVLVTGPTGCGKSTTLAALIEHINQQEARRVVTIEDPIEYVYEDKVSMISQRQVGRDTLSFAEALKRVLRQDVNVVLIGEMRDLPTIAAALTAAETGILVLSTLHTPSAPEAIDRIVDVFPAHQQAQIRMQLSMTLAGVIAQRLIKRADGQGRIAACEIMVGTPAVRNLIREAKTRQLTSVLQTGRGYGMQTMEQALAELYRNRLITESEALRHTSDAETFQRYIRG